MASVSNDLTETVSKLVELTKQLAEAKSDIKVLNQEEKRLKENVKKHMVSQGIDTINLRKGKISIRKSVRKAGINKDAVKVGLSKFFSGDEVKVEGALNAIQDNLKVKESTSLSLTGIKDKPVKEDK
jgi:DNA-binding transcriptional regulator/RsmH inhibitor MraZ|tara:strand:- start:825 stop:1205 length:381 start_codon:yes stop_codon:yes gene_type:complete